MGKNIIINARGTVVRAAVIEDKVLDNLFIDRNETSSIVGNVYVGKVQSVQPSIQAAFIDIGIGKNGFLQIKDNLQNRKRDTGKRGSTKKNNAPRSIEKEYKEGKDVVVQVVKEEIGSKGVRLDTNLSFPGRFLVLMSGGSGKVHISKKIVNNEHRDYLKDKVIPKLKIPQDIDIIIRTAAAGVKQKFLVRDMDILLTNWKNVQDKKSQEAIVCIHEELDLVRKIIRDWLDETVETIFIDDAKSFENLKIFIKKNLANPKVKVRHYKNHIDIFDKFGITPQIEKLYEKKVWLKCGGYLIIDKAEALVAIDVNTGKNIRHSNSDETILETNLEAAEKIARELRLRNMGGIVIIDFIDMRNKSHQREVLKHLQKNLDNDKAKSKVYPFSRLGLVQMSRQRVEESWEQHFFIDCLRCGGTGRILSVPIICDQITSRIRRFLTIHSGISLNVRANPEVIEFLLQQNILDMIEKQYGIEIGYLKDSVYHPEKYLIIRRDTGADIMRSGKTRGGVKKR